MTTTKSKPKFPHIKCKLTGYDGNAFTIMGRVSEAMRKGGCSNEEISAFTKEAMSGDYDHLLRTAMKTVNVS